MSQGLEAVWTALLRVPGVLTDLEGLWKGSCELARGLCRTLGRLLCREPRPPRPRDGCCIDLPPDVHLRPDPLIYPQFYLMKMGLAVTWDNPDIQLFEHAPGAPGGLGAPVSSAALRAGHAYRVQVRVWNGSYHAPALGLPVRLSYLSFGMGTQSHPIAVTPVNLGVKGGAHHPAFALFDWTTPAEAGHYCLQALLEWSDDANPENNLGQENVDVGVMHSPATFTFTLRNDASVRRRFALEADAYSLPAAEPCDPAVFPAPVRDPVERGGAPAGSRLAESRARWKRELGRQSYGMFPVPAGWTVAIEPAELTLAARGERVIHVSVAATGAGATPPASFNVHGFALRDDGTRDLVGGVTLHVAA
jgi:hypothetical protein